MSLKSWFRKPAKKAEPPGDSPVYSIGQSLTAKTSDGVAVSFDQTLFAVWTGGASRDIAQSQILPLLHGHSVGMLILKETSFSDFCRAPGEVCEKTLAELKGHIDPKGFIELRDVAMTKISAPDFALPPLGGSAGAFAAARLEAAQEAAATAQSLTQGLRTGIKVRRPLTLKSAPVRKGAAQCP